MKDYANNGIRRMVARVMLCAGSVCAAAKAIERAQAALANSANLSDEEAAATFTDARQSSVASRS